MAQEGDEDFSRLPLADRLSSKAWKARLSAYTELTHTFKTSVAEDAPEFSPYLRDPDILATALKDANAVAQESAILCTCAFVEYAGKNAASTSKEALTSAIVEKNILGSARAGTKKAATELCLLLVECDNSADVVIEACIQGLKSKQPKAVAGAVAVLKEIVRQFGAKTINVKPVLKVIPSIFGHADKGVRAEGAQLVQELHRWLGSALDPSLSDLKPVQQKELAELFANEEPPSQTRFTRAQQRDRALKDAEASLTANHAGKASPDVDGAEQQEDSEPLDAYDLSEPQTVLRKLPSDFYVNLASSKWKDRKELALDPLLDLLKKAPKLQDANYDDLVRALAAKMADPNIACVISASGCIEALAKGLRQDFARYKPAALPLILERCKEKKASVTDALGSALDAIFQSLLISDLTEDVETFSKHKNPQVKEHLFRFLVRSLQSTKVPPSTKTDLKPLSDALLLGMEDSFAPVRDSAAEGLGTLHKILGDRAMASVLENLDDIKKKKVLDFSQKAVVKCKGNTVAGNLGGPTATVVKNLPSNASSKLTGVKKSGAPVSPGGSDKENSRPAKITAKPQVLTSTAAPQVKSSVVAAAAPIRKPPMLSSMKKQVTASSANGRTSSSTQSQTKTTPAASKATATEPVKYRFTQEDAEAQASTILPDSILTDLKNSAWKTRLGALDALQTWLEAEGEKTEAELIVRTLAKTPGWKESNFQIYGKMAGLLSNMAQSSPTWTRACSALTIGPLSDKLGDVKLKKPAGDALTVYAERFSLQFVLSQAYDSMSKQKAPKCQSEALVWIEQALREFGVVGLAVRELVEFLKESLKSSNASVRTSAMKALVTLRLFVGPDIKAFLQELNPTLLSTIDSEFDKANGQQPPSPTRTSADHAENPNGRSVKGSQGGGDPLEAIFPRQDVSKLVSPSLLRMMSDANWKQRKEALESLQSILEANSRLLPTLGELGTALKQRLPDSNKVVQGLALDAVVHLATGVGKPFDRSAKLFIGPICGILADAKATVRAPALAALTAIYDQCGLDCMIPHVANGLEPANPLQRNELASWLSSRLANTESEHDLLPLVGPVIACLEDKSVDVRKAAQSLLPAIISSVGFPRVMDRASALKPASRSVVIPMLETAKLAVAARSLARDSQDTPTDEAAPALLALTRKTLPIGSSSAASKGLPAVTRSLKTPAISTLNDNTRAPTPLSRPASSTNTTNVSTSLNKKGLENVRPAIRSPENPSKHTRSLTGKAGPASLFRTSDSTGKQTRAARETGALKWLVEDNARADQIEYLQQQMTSHISPDLLALMFSRDHNSDRDHAEALALLTGLAQTVNYDEIESYTPEQQENRSQLLANSDLVLKYVTIRLCDHSSSMVLACLDLVEALFQVMLSARYHMADYEASSFLPSIVAKLGDSKEPIRMRVRSIIRSFGTIYPSSKVFAHLLEHGSNSKSARTRAESIEELAYFLRRQGIAVCQPRRALPEIAIFLAEKDAPTRTAALNALAEAYRQIGDELFEHVQGLQAREQTMLDERLKRTGLSKPHSAHENIDLGTPQRPGSRQSLSNAESRPSQSKPVTSTSRLPALSSAKRRMSALPTPSDPISRGSSRLQSGVLESGSPKASHLATSVIDTPMSSAHGAISGINLASSKHFVPEDPYALINSSNIVESVDALKLVQKAITEEPRSLLAKTKPLINAVTAQMAFAFDGLNPETSQTVLRLCKHLMQTLSGFFDQRELSLAVPKTALATLLSELTKRLLETADSGASDAIVSLSKVLNMVLIRIFHNSDNSACFGSLFLILERVTVNLRDLHGEELASRAKYAELVMKCLWKISKSVRENLENGSLDSKKLLLDIDGFLQAIPPAEWRRRASDNVPLGDMPLRTVKTILQQIVASYGESVYQELSLLEKPENSFVYQYLFRLLNNSRTVPSRTSNDTGVVRSAESRTSSTVRYSRTASEGAPQLHQAENGMNGSPSVSAAAIMSPGRSSDIQMNLALKDIFDKIGNAQESKKGIAELYQFKLQHPEAETRINTWIAATGSFFQSYLRRALANLAAEEAERSSVHVSPDSPVKSIDKRKDIQDAPVRVKSGSIVANDEKLDSLKQMFGVSRTSSPVL